MRTPAPSSASKVELQRELDVALSLRTQDLPEGSIGDAGIGTVKQGRIREVKELTGELELLGFGNVEPFRNPKVPITPSRSAHRAVGAVAKSSSTRHAKC